jgi:phosphatidylinositol glycan class B
VNPDRRTWLVLAAVALAAFVIRFSMAVVAVNEIWPDEIFQTIEQAHRVVFGPGLVPWEFRLGTRSWLFPGALAGIMQLSVLFGAETAYRTWIVVTLCALSVVPVMVVFGFSRRRFGTGAAVAAGIVMGSWFELVYFASKALTEVVAGHLLLCAVFIEPRRRPTLFGMLLGCVCALRVQLVPAALVAVLIAAWRANASQRRNMAIAMLVPVLLAGALDAVTWSYPFQSFVENIRVNVIQGKSRSFGVAPPTAYLRSELEVLSWAALPLWAAAIWGARRAPSAGLTALAIVGVHSLLEHKEYRFVFPALASVVALAAIGVAQVWRHSRIFASLAVVILVAASVTRGLAFSTQHTTLGTKLYTAGSLWSNDRGPLLAFERFGRDRRICGVGLLKISWFRTGGYAWLHRDLPIVLLKKVEADQPQAAAVNGLVAPVGLGSRIGEYERVACWPGACAYERPGSCNPLAGYSLNEVLRARGQ